MNSERIVRFQVPSRPVLEQLAQQELGTPAGLPTAPSEFIREIYFDTPAGDLQRRGIGAHLTIVSEGRCTFSVDVLEGELSEGIQARSQAEAEVDICDPGELFSLSVEPVRLLRSIIDPLRLETRIELETTRRRRTAVGQSALGEGSELRLDAVTVRQGEAVLEFFELEVVAPPGMPAAELTEVAATFRDQYGLGSGFPSRIAHARALLEEVEVGRLVHELGHVRCVAVVALHEGAVALLGGNGELRVPLGEGWGEEACRRVLRETFGSSRGHVRLLGTNPGFVTEPAVEVWLVEEAGEPTARDIVWLPLGDTLARAASSELRDITTLRALHTLLRNVPLTPAVATPQTSPRPVVIAVSQPTEPVLRESREPVDGFQRRATRDLERPPPEAMLNMDLSELAFQERVLALADDPDVPLLERVRFLSILGSNLDQFFRTRVAGFHKQIASGSTKLTIDGLTAAQQLEVIGIRVRRLLDQSYDLLWNRLLPDFRDAGIEVLGWAQIQPCERAYLEENYASQLAAVLTPLAADRSYLFPHIRNLRPALALEIQPQGDDEVHFAAIELPGELPRFLPLPGGRRFVPIEEVIRASLSDLYHGGEVREAHLFRVTRSANLSIDEEAPDRLEAVQEKLLRRTVGPVVRLEVEATMPHPMRERLLRGLQVSTREEVSVLSGADVYVIDRLVDLDALEEIALLPMEELRYPPLDRRAPFDGKRPVWEQISDADKLLRFPYDEFESGVERLLSAAAHDDDVVSIRITLYRTSRTSQVVDLLRLARNRGKEVLTLVELTASFDEQRNIEWARMLESTGIHVIYGPPRMKVHAKVLLIVRREAGELRRYSYIGTGNLNAATATAYTDLGLLTADTALGEELQEVFNGLAGHTTPSDFQHLLVAPVNMRARFLQMIERESQHAMAGRGGRIRVKINGLTDPEVIAALYRASGAGVRCELIVRGICSLRPGVPGLSDNISVRSILGRFLEHARIFEFGNDGDPQYFIGSADWRPRNLSRRVEVATPVVHPAHCGILASILDEDLRNPTAWLLQPDGSYRRDPAIG